MSKQESKIWTIIKHEYTSKVKSKGFIIGSILGPLILIGFLAVTIFVSVISANDTSRKVAIVDNSQLHFDDKLIERNNDIFEKADTKNIDKMQKQILDDEIDAVLVIPDDFLETGKAVIYSKGGGGFGFSSKIERNLDRILRKERLLANGIDTSVIKLIDKGTDLVTKKVTEGGGVEKDYTAVLSGIGYALGFFIYMMMLIYGQFVSRGVIEEKANRIVEVIASSVKPIQIMLGKVVGIGLLGLTQIAFWITMGGLLLLAASPIMSMFIPDTETVKQGMEMAAAQSNMPFDIPSIPIGLIIAFIYYFLIGYFMYSTIFAAVGSAVDQESDAANLQQPIIFAIIIPMLFLAPITSNPDSTLAVILSLIPFFTPILMTVRIAATDVPFWQIATSVVLTVGTVFFLLWIAAKIYRVGILMYGKKPKLKDLIKWVRLAK
jgi:ABC-2 type transport system permease protein